MRRLILLTFFGALSVQAAIATATPETADAAKEKKVCRLEEVTGSIMMHSICHSKEEWTAIDAQNARGAAHVLGRDQAPSNGISATRDQVSRGK